MSFMAVLSGHFKCLSGHFVPPKVIVCVMDFNLFVVVLFIFLHVYLTDMLFQNTRNWGFAL